MPPRKHGGRGRPPAVQLPVPTTYPPKNADGSGLDEPQWMACRDMLEAVFKSKEGSRRMCEIFRELPDKEEWADYYETIPEPECLDNIAARLSNQTFNAPEEFFHQLHLVFLNAMHYNEEGSQIWNDAKKFEASIHDSWRAHAAEGTFANADPKAKGGRGRKSSAKASAPPATPTGPSSSAAATASTPPVTIHLRVPKAEETPAPAPKDTPPSRTRETPRRTSSRQAASPVKVMPPRAAKTEPAPPASLTPASTSALPPSEQAIVDATDAKLPKWEGPRSLLPGDPAPGGILGSGWWGEGSPDYERRLGGHASWKARIRVVADAIEAYKDPNGVRLAEVFTQIPEGAEIPYLPASNHLVWITMLTRARGSGYSTLHDFDKDMSRLFDKARRWFRGRPTEYGAVLTLQRLYNAITAPYPMPIPPNAIIPPSQTKFASLPAGPGVARSLQDTNEALRAGASQEEAGYGVTTSRIPTKDRVFTDEARHKGIAYRVGDYVHLINPDDASRPIVAQIFKTFVPTKGYSTHHVTVCWYFRPEQTTHPAEQMFTENEVFKTAHFCDHPVEDILERISVQPTESATLGRPRTPAFYPGWPLYVCSMRYIDKACLFMRIKKWSNVLPEQLRGTDVTAVVPFERPITLPTVKSPFALGVKGPGSVGRPKRQPTQADDEEEEAAAAIIAPPVARRQSGPQPVDPRSRAATTPSTPGAPPQQRHPYPAAPTQPGPSRTPQAASAYGSPAPQHARPGVPPANYRQPPPQAPLYAVRTFAAVMGGAQVLEQVAVKEYLHTETARLFEQDARHQVLWFSGPPLAPGALKIPMAPNHSIEYLSFLSKRKNGTSVKDARPGKRFRTVVKDEDEDADMDAEGEEEDAEGEDDDDDGKDKDKEQDDLDGDLSRHWWAQGKSEEQVLADLAAIAGVGA